MINLSGHKLLEETPEHFHIEHPDGDSFIVPKAHLHHGTVEAIRQHFADGGEVMADEGGSDEGAAFDPAMPADMDVDPAALGLRPSPGSGIPGPFSSLERSRKTIADFLASGAGPAYGGGSDVPPPVVAPPALAAAPTPDFVPQGPPAPPAVPAAPQAPPAAPGTPSPTASEIRAGAKQEQRAATDLGQQQADAMKQQANTIAAQEQQRQLQEQQFSTLNAQRQTEQERQYQAALAGKVDPMAAWNRRDGSGKASALIGMMLSGIGSGLTGQPNLAYKVLNDEVERDIDAQKYNLGKKVTLLGHFMEQTKNIQSAQALTRASMLTGFAAQLQSQALKSGSQQAVTLAQQHVAQLRQAAAMETAKATETDMQIQQMRSNVDYTQSIRKMAAQGGGLFATSEGKPPSLARQLLLTGILSQSPEKLGEHVFNAPEESTMTDAKGIPRTVTRDRQIIAATPDDAKLAKAKMLELNNASDSLRVLEQYHAQGKPFGSITPDERKRVLVAVNTLKESLNRNVNDINRQPSEQGIKLLSEMIDNPADITSVGVGGSLAGLRQLIEGHRKNAIHTYEMQ